MEHLWWVLLFINQSKIFWEITTSKFEGQNAAQFIFCRYESPCPATKTVGNLRTATFDNSFGGLLLKRKQEEKDVQWLFMQINWTWWNVCEQSKLVI